MPKLERGEVSTVLGTFDASRGTVVFKEDQLSKSWLAREDLTRFPIALSSGRVWDAPATNLPATAATDDLGFVDGAIWGTNAPLLQTIDQASNVAATAAYARFPDVTIPDNWINGETLQIEVSAGMVTTVADTTATVDLDVRVGDTDATVGSDLNATAAVSINSALITATPTTATFTITETSLSPGDKLDVRVAITIEDGATGTAVIGAISKIALLADIRG